MSTPDRLGGVIHTYQKFNPAECPPPLAPPPDLVSPAMEHLLFYGNTRRFTEEELANAVHLDASHIRGLGPSLQAILEMLKERKRKILATYETDTVQKQAQRQFRDLARSVRPPDKIARRFQQAIREEQLYDLENLFYHAGNDQALFARQIMQLVGRLGEKYQIEELAAKYQFTGRQGLTVPEALEVKQELEQIDELIKQLEEAMKNAKLAIIDMEALSEYIDEEQLKDLAALQQQINDYLRELAEQQGLEREGRGRYQVTPKALRLFQSKLLTTIFEELKASRTGRHDVPVVGEGATETQRTKPYEFGDGVAHMDVPATFVNALLRSGPGLPVRIKPDDIVIHKTVNHPKCATAVLLDMSGSMRYDDQYVNVKRMGLALDGLIRKEYPGDFLQFIELFTIAKPRHVSEIAELLPKPVTVHSPWVRQKYDMSRPDVSELMVPPHFTNIQHGLQLARKFLTVQDTPNRQVVLITDGLPTAHYQGHWLYLLYPPDPLTEEATMREAQLCAREGITINIFLLQSWNQSSEDVQFAYRIAESTKGRVFFCAGRELDRFVVWDYLKRRKSIVS